MAMDIARQKSSMQVLKEGILEKQSVSGLIKNWKTRRIVLRAGVIEWRSTEGTVGKPLGKLDINGANVKSGPKAHCLTIVNGAASLVIRAPNNDERNAWMRSIDSATKPEQMRGSLGLTLPPTVPGRDITQSDRHAVTALLHVAGAGTPAVPALGRLPTTAPSPAAPKLSEGLLLSMPRHAAERAVPPLKMPPTLSEKARV